MLQSELCAFRPFQLLSKLIHPHRGISSTLIGYSILPYQSLQKTHKIIHELARAPPAGKLCLSTRGSYFIAPLDGTFNPFPNYTYSGTLRPVYPLSPKRQVPDHIPRPDYAERDDGEPTPIIEFPSMNVSRRSHLRNAYAGTSSAHPQSR